MISTEIINNEKEKTVYDISLDGTFVDALTGLICHNTDGFNFKLPDPSTYRYTKEHPYIGKGSNREVKLGVEYIGYEGDVAEFNDLYMNKVYSDRGVQKMGLGIDEIVSSTINFSRKNYADYFPDKPYPSDVKMVGNTIKSKKMPDYISKFLAEGVRMLLRGEGQKFLEKYYAYIEKIYNYQIPLRDIASKGKIKKSLKEYLEDCKKITKAGRTKSRQAWYELALSNNLKVDNGDTIYYVNTATKKNDSDVKKVTRYYIFDENGKTEITKELEKDYKLYKKENKNGLTKMEWISKERPNVITEEEVLMNSILVPREIIDKEEDVFCEDAGIEYNTAKYLAQFNSRIKPLLVCFSKDIREQIMITNPDDRQYFTEEQTVLVSGQPNKDTDQDTYEQLMTMEDKEIKFWTTYNLIPPFVEECGMGKWEDIVKDYHERKEFEKQNGIDIERNAYNEALEKLTEDDINAFFEEGTIPESLLKIVDIDPTSNNFVSKNYPDIVIGNIFDVSDLSLCEINTEKLED